MSTETPEATAPETPQVSEADLNDLARMVLASQTDMVNRYNTDLAKIEASTGDAAKYVHEIRNSSDDAKVVKFRENYEKVSAALEKSVAEIEAYIKANLVGESLSDEAVATKQAELKALEAEIKAGEGFFAVATKALGADASHLLPKRANARKSVSKGTGQGGVKPRVTGVYVDGALQSHAVMKDGKPVTNEDGTEKITSTFTDAVKFLSDASKTKVETSALQTAYFAAGNVAPADWASAPDKVEFSFTAGEKNYTILVTK